MQQPRHLNLYQAVVPGWTAALLEPVLISEHASGPCSACFVLHFLFGRSVQSAQRVNSLAVRIQYKLFFDLSRLAMVKLRVDVKFEYNSFSCKYFQINRFLLRQDNCMFCVIWRAMIDIWNMICMTYGIRHITYYDMGVERSNRTWKFEKRKRLEWWGGDTNCIVSSHWMVPKLHKTHAV